MENQQQKEQLDGTKTRELCSFNIVVVGDSEVGKSVQVTIIRDGQELVKTVILGRLEEALLANNSNKTDQKKSIIVVGLTVSTITSKTREEMGLSGDLEGVLVSNVEAGSDAETKGIRSGDIITKIGKKNVSSPMEFRDEIDKALTDGRKSLLMLLYRDGSRRFVALSLTD